jgi:hypothetical protein
MIITPKDSVNTVLTAPVDQGAGGNPLNPWFVLDQALLTELQLKADLTETQPVSVASLPLPTGASTLTEQQTQTTELGAIKTAIETIDDWDESDRAKVNIIVGQAGVDSNAGAASAKTIRTITATDDLVVVATGAKADAIATDNTGSWSLISLLKRIALGVFSDGVAATQFTDIALSNADVSVVAAPAKLWGWNIINPNITPVYVKFWDATTASVTVGTTVPKMVLQIPPSGSVLFFSDRQAINDFATAITVACVTGIATASAGAPLTAIRAEIYTKT